MLHRVQVADTSQRQLFRGHKSGFHSRIATAKKTLLRKNNNKKIIAWAKKYKEWAFEQRKSVLWSDESKFKIFGSNHHVFVRRREGEQMVSACVVPPP